MLVYNVTGMQNLAEWGKAGIVYCIKWGKAGSMLQQMGHTCSASLSISLQRPGNGREQATKKRERGRGETERGAMGERVSGVRRVCRVGCAQCAECRVRGVHKCRVCRAWSRMVMS